MADRCSATTWRGTRCTRQAEDNGRCWQHQPDGAKRTPPERGKL